MKRLRSALLAVVELGAFVAETALVAVALCNLVERLQQPVEKKPEQKRWVN